MATRNGSGGRCILLVDDDKHILRLVAQMLVAQGYTVICAVGPERAIQLFEQGREAIDLLLTDVMMPGMNGSELAQRLRASRPDLPVVYMTGYSFPFTFGPHLLEKPFGFVDLQRTVCEAFQSIASTTDRLA